MHFKCFYHFLSKNTILYKIIIFHFFYILFYFILFYFILFYFILLKIKNFLHFLRKKIAKMSVFIEIWNIQKKIFRGVKKWSFLGSLFLGLLPLKQVKKRDSSDFFWNFAWVGGHLSTQKRKNGFFYGAPSLKKTPFSHFSLFGIFSGIDKKSQKSTKIQKKTQKNSIKKNLYNNKKNLIKKKFLW